LGQAKSLSRYKEKLFIKPAEVGFFSDCHHEACFNDWYQTKNKLQRKIIDFSLFSFSLQESQNNTIDIMLYPNSRI